MGTNLGSSALRILWVRHSPSIVGRVTRDTFLLPRIAKRHHVEVVTWNTRETSRTLLGMFSFGVRYVDGLRTWVLPRIPRPPGWPPWRASVNQPLFRVALRAIAWHVRADVLVVGPSWTQVGFPPSMRALRVFDYLDGSDFSEPRWRDPELALLRWCDASICVSEALGSRAEACGKPNVVVPNGVDVPGFGAIRPERSRVREELGVTDRRVVSLVGLTAAADEYWIDAVRSLAARVPRFLFVAVGAGVLARRLRALERELPSQVHFAGAVPYDMAKRWFVASDVTWYPGADIEYFHLASPLKVFEGLAAGTQVLVAPRLRGLPALATPALHFSAPNAAAFADATEAILSSQDLTPADLALLAPYSWDHLADRVCEFIEGLSERRRGRGSA